MTTLDQLRVGEVTPIPEGVVPPGNYEKIRPATIPDLIEVLAQLSHDDYLSVLTDSFNKRNGNDHP